MGHNPTDGFGISSFLEDAGVGECGVLLVFIVTKYSSSYVVTTQLSGCEGGGGGGAQTVIIN